MCLNIDASDAIIEQCFKCSLVMNPINEVGLFRVLITTTFMSFFKEMVFKSCRIFDYDVTLVRKII